MARRHNRGRNVNGILLLDKPLGMTSNAALQVVKRLFQAGKAGHTGNLDPLATGLLPLCLGEATKISGFLLDSDKRYIGTVKLGVTTRTADAEGDVLETRPVPELDESQVKAVLDRFLGTIQQVPPMHSAVKVNGTPLYKLARQGLEIERKARTVKIYSLTLLRLEGDELDIELRCSKGTYVRTLAEEIGEALGCGAHLSALRRTGSGPFDLSQAISLDELEQTAKQGYEALDSRLLPIEQALTDWPVISLTKNTAYYVQQGQPVQVPRAPTSGLVRLQHEDGHFLGVGHILDDGRVAPKRLIRIG
ncbi:MAG: tRNA pseudouridine(55) synthase TruB [Proteobacteria bacterium]|jgi:tRNA pseudouridine55 synthase|nr:tRNA pseudouridine(55) synthase TruB [Pseudomonadota bacterium]MCG6936396.1 tRNA pseudouridine(55) synthase TruB [Pseudomonadota bacterium]